MATTAVKNKTVSNLAMFICTILDLIEPDELDMDKVYAFGPRIDKFLYDLDRQVKKKGASEYYKIDFNSADLQAIAVAAEKHVNKLRPRCAYRSMRKRVDSLKIDDLIPEESYRKYIKELTTLFYVVGLLHRLQCVVSYQAIVLDVLEAEDENNKIENVMLNTLRDAIKKGPNVW